MVNALATVRARAGGKNAVRASLPIGAPFARRTLVRIFWIVRYPPPRAAQPSPTAVSSNVAITSPANCVASATSTVWASSPASTRSVNASRSATAPSVRASSSSASSKLRGVRSRSTIHRTPSDNSTRKLLDDRPIEVFNRSRRSTVAGR